MKLKTLIKDLPDIDVRGSKEIEITGISSNSKQINPGNLFLARKGKTFDAIQFIPQAIENGAVAVLTDLYDPFFKNVTQLITSDISKIIPVLSSKFYQMPAKKLKIVGITGTNGKTTTSFLIKHLLSKLHEKTGLIGTNGCYVANNVYPSILTTPPIEGIQKFLREMVDHECKTAIMEVSSHGLDQKRVDSIDFDAAIFTNLTKEHLDYHHTMDNYAKAKKNLFSLLEKSSKSQKVAIINKDSKWSDFIADNLTTSILTYGIDLPCDVKANNITLYSDHTTFDVHYKNICQRFYSPLIGRFNVYNFLAAICFGIYLNRTLKELSEFLLDFSQVNGRMEKLILAKRTFIVDYAHTPDALKNCLKTLMEIKNNRIITVFGCGGMRDFQKRPIMGEISGKYSDFIIITNDNPRSEDPEAIAEQILKGVNNTSICIKELDREKAIKMAYKISSENDLILVAGKGHEKKQIFAHQTIDFDDCEIIKKVIKCES